MSDTSAIALRTPLRIAVYYGHNDQNLTTFIVALLEESGVWKATPFFTFAQLQAAVLTRDFDVIVTYAQDEDGDYEKPASLRAAAGAKCALIAMHSLNAYGQLISGRRLEDVFDATILMPFTRDQLQKCVVRAFTEKQAPEGGDE